MENEYIDLPSHDLPIATKREAKFMNLLNEYLLKYYAEHGNKKLYLELEGWNIFNVHETVVISNRFGFIKWLIENDKLELDKVKEKKYGRELTYNFFKPNSKKSIEVQYERLLMLLSIQKNPIEFLTNIIK